jgi:2-polyprenyl-3-methyl-5-hydroxy-6-metoxy-1,4-benzoquinol methylase
MLLEQMLEAFVDVYGNVKRPASCRLARYTRGPMSLSRWAFHQITDKGYVYTSQSGVNEPELDEESDRRFLLRMDGNLRFAGKTVLDVGCGHGSLCVAAARAGASEVVGVDLDVSLAEGQLRARGEGLAQTITFVRTQGQLEELAGRQFDLVISKDSMEHFPDPESFVSVMTGVVKPGGELAIGFSPLWKSPNGGHIDYMTKVPWAHLIFSEETIMAERRRFRPNEQAARFNEVVGGLNKMTLARFHRIMASTGLKQIYLATNPGGRRGLKAMRAVAKIPGLAEYFTVGVYGIWRKPAA